MNLKPVAIALAFVLAFAALCWIGARDHAAGRSFTYLCQNTQGVSPLEACR